MQFLIDHITSIVIGAVLILIVAIATLPVFGS